MKPTRIAVVNSHPIQYFAPLYRFLNAAPDLDVTAIYLSDISIRGAAADLSIDQKMAVRKRYNVPIDRPSVLYVCEVHAG